MKSLKIALFCIFVLMHAFHYAGASHIQFLKSLRKADPTKDVGFWAGHACAFGRHSSIEPHRPAEPVRLVRVTLSGYKQRRWKISPRLSVLELIAWRRNSLNKIL